VKHYYGDATRPDLLHAAGIQEAKVLVIAIDDREKISELTHYVSKNYPHVHIVTRAVDRDHVYDLWAHGSRDIIRETYDSSLRMGRSLFEALGIDRPIAEEMLEVFNETDRRAMLAVADAHKVGVASHENDEYVERVRSMLDEWQTQLQADIEVVRQGGPRPDRSADGKG
jgi:CPA2 family monovalent cation:H+ antiporter-2